MYEIVMLVPENDGKKIVDGGKKTNKKTIKKVKKNKKNFGCYCLIITLKLPFF